MSVEISKIVRNRADSRGKLIAILQDIQNRYSYLPKDALEQVSRESGIPLVDIYGVATFYRAFSLTPRGSHLVSVCLGTACHVRGGREVAEELERQLGIKAGGTTPDNQFTLETVNCLGACALGPIVVVDGRYFSQVTPAKVKQILKKAREGAAAEQMAADGQIFPVKVSCPRCNHSLMDPQRLIDGHPAVRMVMAFGGHHGSIWLSSLYGSFNLESDFPIPLDTVIALFCPHCHAELAGATTCVLCGAPMVPMLVAGGGMVQICARRGCKEHRLDINGVNL